MAAARRGAALPRAVVLGAILAASLAAAQEAEPEIGADAPDPGVVVRDHVPTELPGLGFPGASAEASNAAWPSGRQPKRLAAWPQTGTGTENFTLHACWKTRVLHDVANGWPDECIGLFHAKQRLDREQCQHICTIDPRCAVWQLNDVPDQGLQCWVGAGTNCGNRKGHPARFKVIAGQRIVHGDVLVLKSMPGPKIKNLYQIGVYHDGNEETSISRCRGWCYSLISCQYWQYGQTGCWVDAPFFSSDRGMDPEKVVQYPLTASGLDRSVQMSHGEMIQHYCPPEPPSTTFAPMSVMVSPAALGEGAPRAAQASQGGGGLHALWVMGLALAVLVCTAAIAIGLMTGGAQQKSRVYDTDDEEEDVDGPAYGEDSRPLLDEGGGKRQGLPAQGAPGPPSGERPSYMDSDRGGLVSRGDFHSAYRSGNLRLPPSLVHQAASTMSGRPSDQVPPSPYFGGGRAVQTMPLQSWR